MKNVISILSARLSNQSSGAFGKRAFVLASNQWEPTDDVIPLQLLTALKRGNYKKVIADKGSSKPQREARLRDAIALVVGNPGAGQLVSLCQTLRLLGNEPIIVEDAIGAMTDELTESLRKIRAQGVATLTIAQILPLLNDKDILLKAKTLSRK